MLSAVIPGYLVLLGLRLLFFSGVRFSFEDSTANVIVVFTASYIVGLLWKTGTEILTNDWLRNNPRQIRKAFAKAEIPDGRRSVPLPTSDKALKILYYHHYYKALAANPNSSIPILEAQLAFIRSIIPIGIVYTIGLPCLLQSSDNYGCHVCIIQIVSILVCCCLCWLHCSLSSRICRIVWEDAINSTQNNRQ